MLKAKDIEKEPLDINIHKDSNKMVELSALVKDIQERNSYTKQIVEQFHAYEDYYQSLGTE